MDIRATHSYNGNTALSNQQDRSVISSYAAAAVSNNASRESNGRETADSAYTVSISKAAREKAETSFDLKQNKDAQQFDRSQQVDAAEFEREQKLEKTQFDRKQALEASAFKRRLKSQDTTIY